MVNGGVSKFKYPYCQKVLPLVYDDSLSYYENICQFVDKLNEMADYINNIEIGILEEAKAYTDSKVEQSLVEINALVTETKAEFEAILKEQKDDYEDFERLVNAQLTLFNTRLIQLGDKIDADIVGVNARTDLAIKQNNEYIFEEIAKGLIDLKVLNYFTGEYITVQDMFDYLAHFHLQNAISYAQLAQANKTYDEINAYNESYTDWAINGFNIING